MRIGRSWVIALTGHKQPAHQHRNAYQEIPHVPLYASVTKFDPIAPPKEHIK